MKGIVTLVVGATGATGRHVVQQLLNQDRPVHVIVRSKERMISALSDTSKVDTLLTVTEASILDMSEAELRSHIDQIDNVVCCLGHNMTFQGIFGHPRRFVADSVECLTKALAQTTSPHKKKLIVMNSDGVVHPGGSDDKLGFWASIILSICHYLPPHADNEAVASYLYHLAGTGNMEWVVLRPTSLINGDCTEYKLHSKPVGLFGDNVATRANVAKCMVDLITNEDLFTEYKFRMPVVHDLIQKSTKQA